MVNTKKFNSIEFDTWFKENIDSRDLENYVDESIFSNNIHEKFHNLSSKKIVIGSYEDIIKLY
tara:strand:- start:3606 stop:3794 length:189 start_codon:yes stop_codon:yes gene_type:complete